MRDPARIPKVLDKIKELWEKVPDWRLGQLIFNVTGMYDPYHLEDDLLINIIDDFIKHKLGNDGGERARKKDEEDFSKALEAVFGKPENEIDFSKKE